MLKASEQVLFQKLGAEAVLLQLNSEEYFSLDEVATRIYEVLLEKGEVEEALPVLLSEYEVEETQLRADIEELLSALKAEKIIEEV